MSEPQPYPGKIVTGSDGLGTPTPEMVIDRARELAKMDGRTEAHEGDRQRAHAELLGPTEPETPEVDASLAELTEWDEAPAEHGTRAPSVIAQDEMNIAETLVNEGLEEADHDIRKAVSEENPPEEA